jgi:hypothetical protein
LAGAGHSVFYQIQPAALIINTYINLHFHSAIFQAGKMLPILFKFPLAGNINKCYPKKFRRSHFQPM